MKIVSIFTGCCLLLMSAHISAAHLWTDVDGTVSAATVLRESNIKAFPHRKITSDLNDIRQRLFSSASVRAKSVTPGIDIPLPDGSTEKFSVEESPIMSPGLAAKHPEIKTYRVRGIDSPSSSGRVNVTPRGFHAFIYTQKGLVIINPVVSDEQTDTSRYKSFYKKDFAKANKHLVQDFSCGFSSGANSSTSMTEPLSDSVNTSNRFLAKTTGGLITYKLAVAATQEYATEVASGNVTDTMAEIVNAIDAVNAIFERDLAIRLLLVANNDLLIDVITESDGAGGVKDQETLLAENQTLIDFEIGDAGYDVGHLFATVGGGLAGLGNVCVPNFKAEGISGLPNPKGDNIFYIDILAHELGHQFGADHTFNGTTGNCGDIDARNQATAFEPGSGNTIMAYAGICNDLVAGTDEDIQSFADENFHAGSIDEIVTYTRSSFGNCNGLAASANSSPTVNAGPDFVIPLETPFTLSGSALDPESNPLTFQWQQMDTGAATDAASFGTDLGSNPLFISFPSVSTGSRTFPQLSTLLASVTDPGEVLPTTARTMNFRLLVKDGNGGVDSDNIKVRSTSVAGPFKILQPNTSATLNVGQSQVVKWDTACTDEAPVNCGAVDILYSTSNIANIHNFDTVLALNVPNDGEQVVIFPLVNSNFSRIKIMCTDNIFFDVSDVDFSTDTVSGNVLDVTGNGGNSSECVAEPVRRRGGSTSGIFLLCFVLLAGFRYSRRRKGGAEKRT